MNSTPLATVASQPPLSELENEVIALFVDFVRWFGVPKSLGAIYGLLFISEAPISFEQIATRLQLSNGSVSQGLRILKDLGAVKTNFVAGERRDFFVAETQLRQLAKGFLRQRLERHLFNGEGRLSRLLDRALPSPIDGTHIPTAIYERLNLMRRWPDQARGALPAVLKMLEE